MPLIPKAFVGWIPLLSLITSITSAAPLSITQSSSSSSSSSGSIALLNRTVNSSCSFEGNSDLYGLGIRAGIYLQWLSSLLANWWSADSVHDLLATNTIFLLALFVALAITTTQGQLRNAEVIILLQICFGFLFSVSTTWGIRVRARNDSGNFLHFPLFGTTFRACLSTAVYFYNIWFWFRGLDNFDTTTCHALGFLFAPVDIHARARTFLQITAVLFAIFNGISTLAEILLFAWTWISYTVVATTLALLAVLQKLLHSNSSILAVDGHTFTGILSLSRYGLAVIVGTPWLNMNMDTGVRLTRAQSWILIGFSVAIINMILIGGFLIITSLVWDVIDRVLQKFKGLTERLSRRPQLDIKETAIQKNVQPSEKTSTGGEAAISPIKDSSSRRIPAADTEANKITGDVDPKSDNNNQDIQVLLDAIAEEKRKTSPSRLRRVLDKFKAHIWIPAGKKTIWAYVHRNMRFLPMVNFVCFFWSVLAIELMLKWNRITNVYTIKSVGQLIPFIIGVVGFINLLRAISVEQSQQWLSKMVLDSFFQFETSSREDRSKTETPKRQIRISDFDREMYKTGRLSPFRSIKAESRAAKATPMIQLSIGQQMLSLIEEDANMPDTADGPSNEKLNAKKALRAIRKAFAAQEQEPIERGSSSDRGCFWFLKRSHKESISKPHVVLHKQLLSSGLNPQALAMRWLNWQLQSWWRHIEERRMIRKVLRAKSKLNVN